MASLLEIKDELLKQFSSEVFIDVDMDAGNINICKTYSDLWLQIDFDVINKITAENNLIMWMRMEPKTSAKGIMRIVPVFHLHRYNPDFYDN